MCYMRYRTGEIGVRELRQNLSVYLRRVKAGETLEVKERGHRVAVLAPAGAKATLSMRSSKSLTTTRKNNGNNLPEALEIFGAAGTTTNQRSKNNNLWQQLM